jgi:hypothetical protein
MSAKFRNRLSRNFATLNWKYHKNKENKRKCHEVIEMSGRFKFNEVVWKKCVNKICKFVVGLIRVAFKFEWDNTVVSCYQHENTVYEEFMCNCKICNIWQQFLYRKTFQTFFCKFSHHLFAFICEISQHYVLWRNFAKYNIFLYFFRISKNKKIDFRIHSRSSTSHLVHLL